MRGLVALLLLWPFAAYAQVQTVAPGQAPPRVWAVMPPSGIVAKPHFCPPDIWYPPSAIRSGERGATTLAFHVGVNGMTKDITVAETSGFADLDQAAIACASRFTYHPALQNGQPIEIPWRVKINWDLPQQPEPIGPAHDCRNEATRMPQDRPIGLRIVVAVDGSVKSVDLSASSGDVTLDQNLIACVSKWQFKPGIRLGQPTEWILNMPLAALEIRGQ